MSWAAALRASNPSQPNTVAELKYSSLSSTARDHGPIAGTKETPGHCLCDEFWHRLPEACRLATTAADLVYRISSATGTALLRAFAVAVPGQ
jgi:hypothetical protein